MSFFQVSSKEIVSSIEQLKQLNTKFKTEKGNIDRNEQELKTMWEGEANEAFHTAYVRDAGQMDAFYNAIENYIGVLGTILERYEMAEQKNLSAASTRTY